MKYHRSEVPDRMVALSILSPPPSHHPVAPFGFGAFIVTQGRRGEAAFSLHVHGFGAGYRPKAMREKIGSLFTPETTSLIYSPVSALGRVGTCERDTVCEPIWDFVPRSGVRSIVYAQVPYHTLSNASGIAHLQLPSNRPTPLARIGRIGAEAQAIWIYWLFERCAPHLRRALLASFMAGQALDRAKRRTIVG